MPSTAVISMARSPSWGPPTSSGTRHSPGLSMAAAATADARASNSSPQTSSENWEELQALPEEFRDLGDRVLVLGSLRGRGKAAAHRSIRHTWASSIFAATGSGATGCISIVLKGCRRQGSPSRRRTPQLWKAPASPKRGRPCTGLVRAASLEARVTVCSVNADRQSARRRSDTSRGGWWRMSRSRGHLP